MGAFRRKGRRVSSVKVFTPASGWRERTTGTRDPITARKMQQMLDELGPEGAQAFDVLAEVAARRLTVSQLWALWAASRRNLEALRARLKDRNIEPLVAEWRAALSVAEDTAAHYEHYVRIVIPADTPAPTSLLTRSLFQLYADQLLAGGAAPGTVRKAGAAWSSFCGWLVRRGVLERNPMRDVRLPSPAKPRVHYLETHEAQALADAQPWPYRALAALLAGSGIEVSVALALRARDVDAKAREIRAAGTKTHARDRIVRVAQWSWGYVADILLVGKHPHARLFDEIPDRWAAQKAHNAARDFLIERGARSLVGYTMRDHRHTYAVRAVRAGTPYELVARQLGHANAVLVAKVYGRWAPTQAERDKWERIADEQDRAKTQEAIR